VNTLVLRTECGGTPSFRDLLGRVRDTTLGAYTHQDLPFERLVTELAPARDLSRNPLVQVVFQLQNTEAVPPVFGDAKVSRIEDGFVTTRFDTEVHLQEVDGALAGRWICAADIYDEASIDRFTASYIQLLEHICRARF
ncbi:MAG: condensation domain-containing protein, partial [Actinoplanes sp.]